MLCLFAQASVLLAYFLSFRVHYNLLNSFICVVCVGACVGVYVYRAVASAVGLSVLRNTLALFLLYCFITGCVLRTK